MPNRLFSLFAFLTVLFATVCTGYAQSPLDPYKYIIVPKKFDFLKEENQFRVNSTTKYLFDQNGFRTLTKGSAYPEDLQKDPCLAVTADIVDESKPLTTKLYVILLDCHDQEVFRSTMGQSKEKSYEKTYIYALNKAFVSFELMPYKYNPSLSRSNEPEPVAAVPVSVAASDPGPETVNDTPSQELNESKTAVETAAATPVETAVEPAAEPAAVTTTTGANSDTGVASGTASGGVAAGAAAGATAGTLAATSEKEESQGADEPSPEENAAPIQEETEVAMASSYGNENVSFLLIEQGDKLVAYVSDNRNSEYKKGEMIGTLVKTSLPNVFRASWKHMDKDIDLTTAYFDDQGNLKIDVDRGGQIEVLTFKKE